MTAGLRKLLERMAITLCLIYTAPTAAEQEPQGGNIHFRPLGEFGIDNDYEPTEQMTAFMETDGMERRGLEQRRTHNRLDFSSPPGMLPKSVFGFDGDVEDTDATWRFCVCPQRSRIVEMRLNW